jgi:hypothetical protein
MYVLVGLLLLLIFIYFVLFNQFQFHVNDYANNGEVSPGVIVTEDKVIDLAEGEYATITLYDKNLITSFVKTNEVVPVYYKIIVDGKTNYYSTLTGYIETKILLKDINLKEVKNVQMQFISYSSYSVNV